MDRWSINIVMESHLHLGCGEGFGNSIDNVVLRDSKGFPFIPASSFKGRLRAKFMSLSDIIEKLHNESENIIKKGLCHKPEDEYNQERLIRNMCMYENEENYCLLCKIFGSTFYQSKVRFSDLKLVNNQIDLFNSRTSNHIDRKYRITKEDHLYNYEFAYKNLIYKGYIDFSETKFTACEMKLLATAISLITHIGGNKSKGLGRCSIDIDYSKVGDKIC